jgi:nucleoside-diphosphate kinase
MERTLIIIKPDAAKRQINDGILDYFMQKGLTVIGRKKMRISEDMAKEHYKEHHGKDFFDRLIAFITSGESEVVVLEGENAVQNARRVIGATNPEEASEGTIRRDFKDSNTTKTYNLAHGSDSIGSAQREIKLFFPELA